jgi:hypothetical protein
MGVGMADFDILTEKNMEEYTKLQNAIFAYVEFLKEERELPRDRIKDLLAEVAGHTINVVFMEDR